MSKEEELLDIGDYFIKTNTKIKLIEIKYDDRDEERYLMAECKRKDLIDEKNLKIKRYIDYEKDKQDKNTITTIELTNKRYIKEIKSKNKIVTFVELSTIDDIQDYESENSENLQNYKNLIDELKKQRKNLKNLKKQRKNKILTKKNFNFYHIIGIIILIGVVVLIYILIKKCNGDKIIKEEDDDSINEIYIRDMSKKYKDGSNIKITFY